MRVTSPRRPAGGRHRASWIPGAPSESPRLVRRRTATVRSGVHAAAARREDQSGDLRAIALTCACHALDRRTMASAAWRISVAALVGPRDPAVPQALQLSLSPARRTDERVADRVTSPDTIRLAPEQEQQVEHADGVDVPGDQALCVTSEIGARGQACRPATTQREIQAPSGSTANRPCGHRERLLRWSPKQV